MRDDNFEKKMSEQYFFRFIGCGCTTSMIRVFAALDLATDLKTMTSEAVKIGLTKAVDTSRPVVECLSEAAADEMKRLPHDHYLSKDKYK